MIGTYEGFDFGQTVARDLLDNHQILTHGERYLRKEVVRLLVQRYLERGGSDERVPPDPARTIKNLLPKKDEKNERFENVAHGHYRYIGRGNDGMIAPSQVPPDDANPNALEPDRARGTGRYEVYAWCLPQDENAAAHWPIKIGYAGEGGFFRRWLQDFATHLPVRPRYLRSFRHESEAQARNIERYLHELLGDEGRLRRVRGIPGTEWFLTSPGEIDQLMEFRSPHLFASDDTP